MIAEFIPLPDTWPGAFALLGLCAFFSADIRRWLRRRLGKDEDYEENETDKTHGAKVRAIESHPSPIQLADAKKDVETAHAAEIERIEQRHAKLHEADQQTIVQLREAQAKDQQTIARLSAELDALKPKPLLRKTDYAAGLITTEDARSMAAQLPTPPQS
jgi:hypothetical protein